MMVKRLYTENHIIYGRTNVADKALYDYAEFLKETGAHGRVFVVPVGNDSAVALDLKDQPVTAVYCPDPRRQGR